jgi:pimeloyl-ACP methyl ester carboxylesterase
VARRRTLNELGEIMKRILISAIALTFCIGLTGLASHKASAQSPRIATEEMMIPSSDAGIEIYIRNERPADMASFRPERTVLFVHGSVFPAHTTFDLQLDGISWMDYIAARGYDVWLLDVRGYGKSTRPKEMAEKPEANPPIVRTDTAIKDVSTVIELILARRNIPRLELIGWSWGTALIGIYTTRNPGKVERLVLYAPNWIRTTASPLVNAGPVGIPAYGMMRKDRYREVMLVGVPEDKKATILPAGWFETFTDAIWATDPVGAQMNPPVLRFPNGAQQDVVEYWSAGKPLYDPAKITVPTLVVGAEWDGTNPPYMRQTLFPLLVNSPGKRYVEIAEGSHAIMLQKNRLKLFEAVQAFLDESGRS